tara:strand:- start:67 stop:207 length:141 start_codon:yes stop_codon:yes gene_type:complete
MLQSSGKLAELVELVESTVMGNAWYDVVNAVGAPDVPPDDLTEQTE